MKFNINNYVRVKLTNKGREIHKDYYNNLYRHFPGKHEIPKIKEDKDGWSEWQLWELMSIFGASCYNGCEVPFETNIEIITESKE